METEERVKALEAEFQTYKAELRQILLDLRTHMMEVQTPFQARADFGGASAESDSERG